MKSTEIIAFYLPQFHPFQENDEWWGKGFTEWTNVGKAKPMFKGHDQPRVPTELGYYDLRLPIVREQQAQMARESGVTAFCYWHYWFGNGKRLIADIFDEVLSSGNPDFPFCLGWANHSWYAKNWNKSGAANLRKVLIEQTYPGEEDMRMHFDFLIKAFKDERYLKIDGRPFFYIFDPVALPKEYMLFLDKKVKEAGFINGLYWVGNVIASSRMTREDLLEKGFDSVNYQRLGGKSQEELLRKGHIRRKIEGYFKAGIAKISNCPPNMHDYSKEYHCLLDPKQDSREDVIPSLLPQWDHTPRSGFNGTFFINSEPKYFYEHAKEALSLVKNKKHPMLMLKSWNEWGEGNYMEPDITHGRGFIEALRKAVDESK